MNRDRAYYRTQRSRHINRKLFILKRHGGGEAIQAWTDGEFGRLSKGKIHCSCWMCRRKSYDEYSHRDAKQMQRFWHQLKELYSNE
jgi:hypothetical protein